jgi:hypothetical protein
MKCRPAFGLVLLLALAASAQQPALNPAELAAVEGSVLRADTGEPLRRAVITVRVAEGRGTPFSVSTDAMGRFRIDGLPPGRYWMTAERNGFVRAEYGQRAPGRAGSVLAVGPGERLRDVVLRMTPASAVTGRVWDEYGDPVAGAQVRLFRYRYAGGQRQLAPAGQAQTNDLGEYRVFGLSPGHYYLSVAPTRALNLPGFAGEVLLAPVEPAGEEIFAPTFYPRTADPSRAVPIEVRAGEDVRGVDVSLVQVRTVSVRGRLLRPPDDSARGGLMLRLMPREMGAQMLGGAQATPQGPEGNFEFRRVTPGSYTLLAMTMGTGESWFARETVEVGGADVEGLLLTMQPAAQLHGRVVVEGQPAFQFNNVSVRLDGGEWSFSSQVPGPASAGGARSSVTVSGEFRFQRVPPDRYQIAVLNLPPGFYLKAARVAGRDILDEGLELHGGQSLEVEVIVSAAGGRATGIVLDDERRPVAAATVVLAPEEPRRHLLRLYETAQTDPNGQFLLQGLAPGDYLLFAFDDLEPGQHLDPLFLRGYLDRGARVRIAEGAVALAELRLLHVPH